MAVTRFYRNKVYRVNGNTLKSGAAVRHSIDRHSDSVEEFTPLLGERWALHNGRLPEFRPVVRGSEVAAYMGKGRHHTATLVS